MLGPFLFSTPSTSSRKGRKEKKGLEWGWAWCKSASRSQRRPWGRRRLIFLPLVSPLSWAEDQRQRRVCEVRREGTRGPGLPVQFLTQVPQRGYPHPKTPSPNEQADYKTSDGIQALRSYWGPAEVAKIKGQGPRLGGEWGDSLSVGALTWGSHHPSALSPCLLPARWRERRKGDWIG